MILSQFHPVLKLSCAGTCLDDHLHGHALGAYGLGMEKFPLRGSSQKSSSLALSSRTSECVGFQVVPKLTNYLYSELLANS